MPDLTETALRSALRWIARNTPMVCREKPELDPISEAIADEADHVRGEIRVALAAYPKMIRRLDAAERLARADETLKGPLEYPAWLEATEERKAALTAYRALSPLEPEPETLRSMVREYLDKQP